MLIRYIRRFIRSPALLLNTYIVINKAMNLSLCLVAVPVFVTPHEKTDVIITAIIKSAINKSLFSSFFFAN